MENFAWPENLAFFFGDVSENERLIAGLNFAEISCVLNLEKVKMFGHGTNVSRV